MRPSLKLPWLPGAVRPGPAAACGEAPERGRTHRPAPTSQRSSPPRGRPAHPMPHLAGTPRPRRESQARESCSRRYHSRRCSASHSNPGKMARRRGWRPRRMCERGRDKGRSQGCFWPHPGCKGQSEPRSVLRWRRERPRPLTQAAGLDFFAQTMACSASGCAMDCARSRQRRERPSILGQAE